MKTFCINKTYHFIGMNFIRDIKFYSSLAVFRIMYNMNFRDPRAISRSRLLKVSSDITFTTELAGPKPIFALKHIFNDSYEFMISRTLKTPIHQCQRKNQFHQFQRRLLMDQLFLTVQQALQVLATLLQLVAINKFVSFMI